jgi:type II secretory pathway component PulC
MQAQATEVCSLMIPRRVVWAVALSGLLLLVGVRAWAGEEGHTGNSPVTAVPTHAPPLLVTGTLISPPTKVALIVILDEQGKATRELKLHEGEDVNGYRITTIRQDTVYFERDGRTFPIRVGNNRQPIPTTINIVTPYERKKEKPANFVPPPGDIEDIKKQTETFMERLKESAEFQKGLEEMRRRLRERSEAPQGSALTPP